MHTSRLTFPAAILEKIPLFVAQPYSGKVAKAFITIQSGFGARGKNLSGGGNYPSTAT